MKQARVLLSPAISMEVRVRKEEHGTLLTFTRMGDYEYLADELQLLSWEIGALARDVDAERVREQG